MKFDNFLYDLGETMYTFGKQKYHANKIFDYLNNVI